MNHQIPEGSLFEDLPDYDYLERIVVGHVQDVLEPIPPRGIFDLRANNRKKRGKMQPIRSIECEGTLYSNGHVNLDTAELQVNDFLSMRQMQMYLESWGDYTLEWLVSGGKV